MVFSSLLFLYAFLPLSLLAYVAVSGKQAKNVVLLVSSLIFYAWGEPVYVLLLMFMALVSWFCALRIQDGASESRKLWLVVSCVVDIVLIGYFKYAGLICSVFGTVPEAVKSIALPIGISFYIFQSMSYVIDVYRNDAPIQKKLVPFSTYVTLFPQLIAGPIVRYADVASMLDHRRENMTQFASGVNLFIVGLGKKVLLANPMGNLWNLLQAQQGTAAAWMGLIAYSLQIYFDFSGYSDMAIGLGRMFGFEFLINFNYPYISASITEFWRRWHISLSTWFKEYVYIPLGGNRKGLKRQVVNMIVVWLLTGLWHGASWNFVFWGGYYAILLILEKSFLLKALQKIPAAFRHIYAMVAVALGWALFYFENMNQLGAFLLRLFTPVSSQGAAHIMLGYLPMMAVSIFAAMPFAADWFKKKEGSNLFGWCKLAAAALVMILCVAALAKQSYNPFIYFRF